MQKSEGFNTNRYKNIDFPQQSTGALWGVHDRPLEKTLKMNETPQERSAVLVEYETSPELYLASSNVTSINRKMSPTFSRHK